MSFVYSIEWFFDWIGHKLQWLHYSLWLIDLVFFQVKIHAEEMSESETAFMLEQGQLGMRRMGQQLGPLAGWLKDIIDQEHGPDWQVIVGKKGSFGSCLSPMAGHYINFSIDTVTFLIFKAN